MEVEGMGEVIHGAVRGENIESQIDMSALPEEPMGRPRDLLPPGTASAPPPATDPAAQQVPVQVLPPASPPAPARPAIAAPARPAPAASAPAASAPAKPAPAATRPAPLPAAPPVAAKPVPTPPAAAATKGGTLVQIGAFSSEAKAEEEWARVSRKGGLSGKRIEKLTTSAGKTLWRVRGVAADPAAACTAIKAMGGACEAVKS
jgi:cell division protein FtsN